MLAAQDTLAHMWENAGKEASIELDPERSERDKSRKQVRLPVFSSSSVAKTVVPRGTGKQTRHIRELKKTISVLSKSGTGGTPMVSGPPPQMGDSKGVMQGFTKSKALDIVSKYADGAISKQLPAETSSPHTCCVDMATIVHQVSPQAYGTNRRSRTRLLTWADCARHIFVCLIWELCSREGTIEGDVILGFDKRDKVANPKSYVSRRGGEA